MPMTSIWKPFSPFAACKQHTTSASARELGGVCRCQRCKLIQNTQTNMTHHLFVIWPDQPTLHVMLNLVKYRARLGSR